MQTPQIVGSANRQTKLPKAVQRRIYKPYNKKNIENLTFVDARNLLNLSSNSPQLMITPQELQVNHKESFSFIAKSSYDTEQIKFPDLSRNKISIESRRNRNQVNSTLSPSSYLSTKLDSIAPKNLGVPMILRDLERIPRNLKRLGQNRWDKSVTGSITLGIPD